MTVLCLTVFSPIIAIKPGNSRDCVQLLLSRGADVHALYWNGWSALHEAACTGRSDILKDLLAADASIDLKDEDGITPVFTACQYGQTQCLEELLNYYAQTSGIINIIQYICSTIILFAVCIRQI